MIKPDDIVPILKQHYCEKHNKKTVSHRKLAEDIEYRTGLKFLSHSTINNLNLGQYQGFTKGIAKTAGLYLKMPETEFYILDRAIAKKPEFRKTHATRSEQKYTLNNKNALLFLTNLTDLKKIESYKNLSY